MSGGERAIQLLVPQLEQLHKKLSEYDCPTEKIIPLTNAILKISEFLMNQKVTLRYQNNSN